MTYDRGELAGEGLRASLFLEFTNLLKFNTMIDRLFVREHVLPLLEAFDEYRSLLTAEVIWKRCGSGDQAALLKEMGDVSALCAALRAYADAHLGGGEEAVAV